MSRKFVVIHEALADFVIATELADRVFVESVNWLEETLLDSQRLWIGEDAGSRLTWASIKQRTQLAGIRVHGHFDGEPGAADAHAGRRAIIFVLSKIKDVEAIVLVRDADDQPERARGLAQARGACEARCPIAIGIAICEREAWVISGFETCDEIEADCLAQERQNLGFDPCTQSHLLTACKDDTARKSPKRVLAALLRGERQRERKCWTETPLETLRARGGHNGASKYLNEVRERLLPVITG